MNTVRLTIDGKELTVPDFISVRIAALKNGIYIPGLCSHPELDSFKPFSWSEVIWQGGKRIEHVDNPPLPPPAIAGGESKESPPRFPGGESKGGVRIMTSLTAIFALYRSMEDRRSAPAQPA